MSFIVGSVSLGNVFDKFQYSGTDRMKWKIAQERVYDGRV